MSREVELQDPLIESARRALEEAREITDFVRIRNEAQALRTWAARQRMSRPVQNRWAEINLRAERGGGQALAAIPRRPLGGNLPLARHDDALGDGYLATLEDVGLSEPTARRWQAIAAIPEERFEEIIRRVLEEDDELTTALVLKAGIGAHVGHASGENEWYTPAEYIEAARRVMGGIDLDPASSAAANEIVQAERYFDVGDDGLTQEWQGRVWMNPPYAQPLIEHFCQRLVGEFNARNVSEACVLVNNATETTWFQTLATVAGALCLPRGRVRFWSPEKTSAAPLQGQAVLYLGENSKDFQREFADFGLLWLAP